MFIFIPYSTEVLITKWPVSNLLIIAICVLVYVACLGGYYPDLEFMVLSGWNPAGLVGHQFMHAGFLHLAGNMLFLWIFGNAVCEKVGNFAYLFIFLALGVAAAGVHNILDGGRAIGASGAIMGLIATAILLDPLYITYFIGIPLPSMVVGWIYIYTDNSFTWETQLPPSSDLLYNTECIV